MMTAGRRGWALLVAAFALALPACSSARYGGDEVPAPGVTLPARFPEGETDAEADAGSGRAVAQPGPGESRPPRTGYPPDPKALRLARQWEYKLVYDRGKVRVASVTERRFSQPVVTARRIGRYAIELWIGQELIERVRFDFPLLGAETVRTGPRRPLKEPPSFAEGAVVSRRVLVPASLRARRAILLDRATGETHVLPWPPDAPRQPLPTPASRPRAGAAGPDAAAGAADAGANDAAAADAGAGVAPDAG